MTAAFAREGDDARMVCDDPAFSYFLVSGSLMLVEISSVQAAPSLLASTPRRSSGASSATHRAPSVEVAATTESSTAGETSTRTCSPKRAKTSQLVRPATREVEQPPGLAFCAWSYPNDVGIVVSGSAATPVPVKGGQEMDDGGDVASAFSKDLFSVPTAPSATEASASPPAPDADTEACTGKARNPADRAKGRALSPGQSLDAYLLREPGSAAEEPGTNGKRGEAGRPGVVPAFPEGSNGDATGPRRRWRLEAQERVCVGRVSLRFLRELEREEPKREVDVKVTFLRRSEVSGDTSLSWYMVPP